VRYDLQERDAMTTQTEITQRNHHQRAVRFFWALLNRSMLDRYTRTTASERVLILNKVHAGEALSTRGT
jgi:hypothetical protein